MNEESRACAPMREAAAHKKRLRKEAKSGLGRLDHDDQTIIADLPRDNLEEDTGSNGFGSKGTGHGWAAEGKKQVPAPPTALRGGSKSPCAARRRTGHSLQGPLKAAQRGLEGPC